MRYHITRQNEGDLHQKHIVWVFKVAMGSVSGFLLAAAIFVSLSFSLQTTAVLAAFAVAAAWISLKMRD
jgi:hypothetical protein